MFSVYIIRSTRSGRYYIGQARDVWARLERHNGGGCTATRGKGPWELVWSRSYATRGEAMAEESRLKRMKSRAYIERLIHTCG